MHSQGCFIDGNWCKGNGPELVSINPCNDTPLWQGNEASAEDVEAAFHAAWRASYAWQHTPEADRLHYLQQFVDLLKQDHTQLAEALSQETGKPLWEAKQEIQAVIDKLHHSCQAIHTRTHPTDNPPLHLRFKPLGIVGILGAFNFPIHLSHGHIIPALLAGNTVIYKPSELTPSINEKIMTYWQRCGLPHGVINLVQGGFQTAQYLMNAPIQALYFTGSYQAGRQIHAHFNQRPDVLLALEMGGNNPLLIDEVSNVHTAVYYTLLSAFITAGQRCSCARRLLLPRTSFGDRFLETLVQMTKQLIIGCPTAVPEPFMGPVIRQAHAARHLQQQEALIQQGAQALLPMQRLGQAGAFLSPGILEIDTLNQVEDIEIFAPLLQVYRYTSLEEGIALANRTAYGLAAGCFTDDPQFYQHFYQRIRAGVVTWNRPTTGASSALPFGGIGRSGNHRPSAAFAADYCAYPVACTEEAELTLPSTLLPGITL